MSKLKLTKNNIKIGEIELIDKQSTSPALKIGNKYASLIEYSKSEYPIKISYNSKEYGFGEHAEEISENSYLTFASDSSFSLRVNNKKKNWNGVLEYSLDKDTWNIWNGTDTLETDEKLYLRGTGNTVITGNSFMYHWILESSCGDIIHCLGNIETLLDYQTVLKSEHPLMDDYCYFYMFYGCANLDTAPELPATKMTEWCYDGMFYDCTGLVYGPELPAMELAPYCYSNMFVNCESLYTIPELPATTLANSCYEYMFSGCTFMKFSETQTEECPNEYRIPYTGIIDSKMDGTELQQMFRGTSGTFTSSPQVNTIYYTNAEVKYCTPACVSMSANLMFINNAAFSTIIYNYDDGSENKIRDRMIGFTANSSMQYMVGQTTPFFIPKGVKKIKILLDSVEANNDAVEELCISIPECNCNYSIMWEPGGQRAVQYYLVKVNEDNKPLSKTCIIDNSLHYTSSAAYYPHVITLTWDKNDYDEDPYSYCEMKLINQEYTDEYGEWDNDSLVYHS